MRRCLILTKLRHKPQFLPIQNYYTCSTNHPEIFKTNLGKNVYSLHCPHSTCSPTKLTIETHTQTHALKKFDITVCQSHVTQKAIICFDGAKYEPLNAGFRFLQIQNTRSTAIMPIFSSTKKYL